MTTLRKTITLHTPTTNPHDPTAIQPALRVPAHVGRPTHHPIDAHLVTTPDRPSRLYRLCRAVAYTGLAAGFACLAWLTYLLAANGWTGRDTTIATALTLLAVPAIVIATAFARGHRRH